MSASEGTHMTNAFGRHQSGTYTYSKDKPVFDELDTRIDANQRRLTAEIRPSYDFIVCGSGSSGSVVARRLAETAEGSVLLVEDSGSDDSTRILESGSSR